MLATFCGLIGSIPAVVPSDAKGCFLVFNSILLLTKIYK